MSRLKYEANREIAGDIDEQARVEFSSSVLDDGGSDYGAETEDDEDEKAERTGMEDDGGGRGTWRCWNLPGKRVGIAERKVKDQGHQNEEESFLERFSINLSI